MTEKNQRNQGHTTKLRQVSEPLLLPSGLSGRHVRRCEILASFFELINFLEPFEGDKPFTTVKRIIFIHTATPAKLHKYAWSPDLCKAGLLLQYWKSCQADVYQESNSYRTHASIQQRLQQHDHRYQLPSADDMTDVEIHHEISQACAQSPL